MLYDLNNPYQREEFKMRVNELYQQRKVVDLKRKAPSKTCRQNRYLHLIISWWAVSYGCTAEYAKRRFFKIECNSPTFVIECTAKDGTKYKDLRSCATLDTAEMTLAIERFRNYCAEHGQYLPSPEEHEYLLYLEREVEKNKQYL